MASRTSKWHGKVEGTGAICAVPRCCQPGEFKAPLEPSSPDGPGRWHWLCLEHVREHNARYNYFTGMSADEISDAQSVYGGWERPSQTFAHAGADPVPKWSDFSDPLDAIATRFQWADRGPPQRFSPSERRAMAVLGLSEDVDRTALRQRYSTLVRRFHPDRNGGDRGHEKQLGEVIDAYQLLKGARAFA